MMSTPKPGVKVRLNHLSYHSKSLNKLIMIKGTSFPYGIYDHGSAYYNDTFVVVGGYRRIGVGGVSITDIFL